MTGKYFHWPSMQTLTGNNEPLFWLIAGVLSLSVHMLLVLQRQPLISSPSPATQESITHIRFATITPTPVKLPAAQVMPVKQSPEAISPRKPAQPKIQPDAQEVTRPRPKASPRPAVKKPLQHKTKPRIVKKPVTKPRQKTSTRNQTTDTTQTARTPKTPASKPDRQLLEQTRRSYKALLMRHIEAHKHYPRVARKRNIQGKILVSFTLLTDGSIKNLSLSGKKSILKKATQRAINNALPMPTPPRDLSLPMEIKFNMNYSLK